MVDSGCYRGTPETLHSWVSPALRRNVEYVYCQRLMCGIHELTSDVRLRHAFPLLLDGPRQAAANENNRANGTRSSTAGEKSRAKHLFDHAACSPRSSQTGSPIKNSHGAANAQSAHRVYVLLDSDGVEHVWGGMSGALEKSLSKHGWEKLGVLLASNLGVR